MKSFEDETKRQVKFLTLSSGYNLVLQSVLLIFPKISLSTDPAKS